MEQLNSSEFPIGPSSVSPRRSVGACPCMPLCCTTSAVLEPSSTKKMPKVAIVYYSMCAPARPRAQARPSAPASTRRPGSSAARALAI